MTKYDKIYIPVNQMSNEERVYLIATDKTNTGGGNMITMPLKYQEWLEQHSNQIVLTEDELLDLMQESIEQSYPTLLRDKAKKLLDAKLKPL